MYQRVIPVKIFDRSFAFSPAQLARKLSDNATTSKSDENEKNLTNAKPFKDVPTITALPFIGTTWTFLPIIGKYDFRKIHKASESKFKEYGKIVREDVTSYAKYVHLFDPADFEKVYRNEGQFPTRPTIQVFGHVIASKKDIFTHPGLLNSNGEEWYTLRSKVQGHMLKPRTTINYLPSMDQVAQEFVQRMQYLRDPESLEIEDYMTELCRFALESIGLVGLDTRLGCFKADLTEDSETMKLIKAAGSIFDMMFQLEFKAPFWRLYKTPLYKKFNSTIDFFTEVAQKYLRQARERLEKNQDNERDLSLLELLLTEDMEPRNVNVMINDMFLAGIDTTSNSAGFFLFHIAKHPSAQDKLYSEIKRLLPELNSPITSEVLNEMRYLKACIKESMRLLPVVSGSVRKLAKDTELAGYLVPAGTQVAMAFNVACRDEAYFKDPLEYKPERWLRENPEFKQLNPFVSLPFGFGTRSCIGRRIAEQELYTVLIRILQSFRVEYHYEDIDSFSRLVNVPDKPLRYQFHDRV